MNVSFDKCIFSVKAHASSYASLHGKVSNYMFEFCSDVAISLIINFVSK